MNRSGYYDDCEDPLEHGRWRAQVRSATRGKRGQKLLRDMLAALDAMPEKRLIAYELEVSHAVDLEHAERWAEIRGDLGLAYYFENILKRCEGARNGDVCALGALGKVRGLDMRGLNPDAPEAVAHAFDVAEQLAREIVFMNDEYWGRETPEQRWQRMRGWVASQISETTV